MSQKGILVTGGAGYIVESERRAGADKVREVLGWTPRYDDLSTIASSALAWERAQRESPWTNE